MGLTAVGVLALLGGLGFLAFSDDEHSKPVSGQFCCITAFIFCWW
jgi:hypothetical protein